MKKIIISLLVAAMAMPLAENICAAGNPSLASDKKTEKKAAKKKKDIRTIVLSADIHCKNCSNKVMNNIAFEKGVEDLEVSVEKKQVKIKYDAAKTTEEALLAAMKMLGYPATVIERSES